MKYYLTFFALFLILVLAERGVAQAVPQYHTTIYFEDAVGNTDSVTVGFDTMATSSIDPIFGEAEVTAPFDSVFEVRAGTFLGLDREKTSKIIIESSEPIYPLSISYGCYTTAPMFIYIWAKYQPVTATWNKSEFLEDICVRGSLLSNHYADELTDPYDWEFFPQDEYYCMGVDSAWTIDISATAIEGAQVTAPVSIDKEVEGMGVQQIYGLRFFPSPTFTYWTPCYFVTSIEEAIDEVETISIVPNPADKYFSVVLPAGEEAKTIEIWNIHGQRVKNIQSVTQVDVSDLSSGMYTVVIETIKGNFYSEKLAKL
jgi:hypothetical protein